MPWWMAAFRWWHDVQQRHAESRHETFAAQLAGNGAAGICAAGVAKVFLYERMWRRAGVPRTSSLRDTLQATGGVVRGSERCTWVVFNADHGDVNLGRGQDRGFFRARAVGDLLGSDCSRANFATQRACGACSSCIYSSSLCRPSGRIL